MVKFRQLNLLSNFSHLGMFDLIFCRNVLIYFDQETKIDVLERPGADRLAAMAIWCLARRKRWSGLTDSFKLVPDKRGLYAPNAQRARSRLFR